MIKKIKKVEGFGIFNNFNWEANTPEFEKYNLFYGWNYSGKTTLSRIFRCFEQHSIHKDYLASKFSVVCDDGSTHNETNLNDLEVRVFNTDFINENLKWDDCLEPIFLLSQENIELQEKLKKINEEIENNTKDLTILENINVGNQKSLDSSLTSKASEIRGILAVGKGDKYFNYDRTPLLAKIQSIDRQTIDKNILNQDDQEKYLHIIRNIDKLPAVSPITTRPSPISELIDKVSSILSKTITSTSVIEKLEKNSILNNWVEKGLEIHKDKKICEFCGGNVTTDLINKLEKHYSKEYENFVGELSSLITNLSGKRFDIVLSDQTNLYKTVRGEYKKKLDELEVETKKYNLIIDTLLELLEKKKLTIFSKIVALKVDDNTEQISKTIDELNQLIQKHNQTTEAFEEERLRAKNLMETHLVSEYISSDKYDENKKIIQDQLTTIKTSKEKILQLKTEIVEIEEKLSDTVKAAEKVNQYLRYFFGKDDIELKVTDDKKFRLERGGIVAKNLSEGEKTAVAFAYFLTRLEDKNTSIRDTIIFLDDPISSLDSNHLFNVFSFIKIKLKESKQLFISTHNFEFFNLVKDWYKEEEKRCGQSHIPSTVHYYLIKVMVIDGKKNSVIATAPRLITDFKSEYHYLFSLLYLFHKSPQIDGCFLLLPHVVRRYVEAFVSFKAPEFGDTTARVGWLIPDPYKKEKIIKFINENSHDESIDKSVKFPSIDETDQVIGAVLDEVKVKDDHHFKSLEKVINKNNNVTNN